MAAQDRKFILLLGAPGAGKGTQAQILQKKLGLPHIATGDLFRYNLSNNTELGLLAKRYMDSGDLVPDDVTIKMVEERICREDCEKGAIFDGFPRNLNQVVALEEMLKDYGGITLALMFVVDDEVVVSRISGRRSCRGCGAVYHDIFNPPKVPGICDICGSELYQRDDDKPETVKSRLYVYYKQTAPLIGYYFAKGLLEKVNAVQSVDMVTADACKVLQKYGISEAE